MKTNLSVVCGMVLGMAAASVQAEFSGYYSVVNPPGGNVPIPAGSSIAVPNWVASAAVQSGLFNGRSPSDPSPATAWTLTAGVSGAGGTAAFEIIQPSIAESQLPIWGYNFTWNFNAPGNSAEWIDHAGVHPITSSVGLGFFDATPNDLKSEIWGFYIKPTVSAQSAALNIQGWEPVPEPSSIAMGILTCVGAIGYAVRRNQSKKQ